MIRYIKFLSLIDVANFIFWLLMFLFFLYNLPQSDYIPKASFLLGVLFLLLAVVIYFRTVNSGSRVIKLVLAIYPAIFLILIFDSLHMVMPYMIGDVYDEALANIDYAIFGFHPTVAIEPIVTPSLTEIMYYLYVFYFPMPFFILVYLYIRKKYIELDKSIFFFLLTYYGSYLLYFAVPALGPRFYEPITDLQNVPLNGLWFTDIIRDTINFLENNKYDAFPSLHAAIALVTIIVMGKYRPNWLYFFIPVTIGIFISLVYCRYHYVIDIFAGVAWTMICWFITEKYHKLLLNKYFVTFYS
ncbi:MAG: phosphatase PAP2 family protein [Saprospiraceae bacterium]|nr:phosphatase PAP2 family protein [Saprospiraceae bacterium]